MANAEQAPKSGIIKVGDNYYAVVVNMLDLGSTQETKSGKNVNVIPGMPSKQILGTVEINGVPKQVQAGCSVYRYK